MVNQIRSDQLLSRVRLFATPWIAARQASLSITNSRSSLRLTSIESVMPSSHLILRRPLLLLVEESFKIVIRLKRRCTFRKIHEKTVRKLFSVQNICLSLCLYSTDQITSRDPPSLPVCQLSKPLSNSRPNTQTHPGTEVSRGSCGCYLLISERLQKASRKGYAVWRLRVSLWKKWGSVRPFDCGWS